MKNDWEMVMTTAGPCVVKVDGVDVCQCHGTWWRLHNSLQYVLCFLPTTPEKHPDVSSEMQSQHCGRGRKDSANNWTLNHLLSVLSCHALTQLYQCPMCEGPYFLYSVNSSCRSLNVYYFVVMFEFISRDKLPLQPATNLVTHLLLSIQFYMQGIYT